jgi:hypothetical protein
MNAAAGAKNVLIALTPNQVQLPMGVEVAQLLSIDAKLVASADDDIGSALAPR